MLISLSSFVSLLATYRDRFVAVHTWHYSQQCDIYLMSSYWYWSDRSFVCEKQTRRLQITWYTSLPGNLGGRHNYIKIEINRFCRSDRAGYGFLHHPTWRDFLIQKRSCLSLRHAGWCREIDALWKISKVQMRTFMESRDSREIVTCHFVIMASAFSLVKP